MLRKGVDTGPEPETLCIDLCWWEEGGGGSGKNLCLYTFCLFSDKMPTELPKKWGRGGLIGTTPEASLALFNKYGICSTEPWSGKMDICYYAPTLRGIIVLVYTQQVNITFKLKYFILIWISELKFKKARTKTSDILMTPKAKKGIWINIYFFWPIRTREKWYSFVRFILSIIICVNNSPLYCRAEKGWQDHFPFLFF